MTGDEARALLEGAKGNLEQILAAAVGDEEPVPDDSADSETQSVARADSLIKFQAGIDAQLIALEAEAALLGVR